MNSHMKNLNLGIYWSFLHQVHEVKFRYSPEEDKGLHKKEPEEYVKLSIYQDLVILASMSFVMTDIYVSIGLAEMNFIAAMQNMNCAMLSIDSNNTF